MRSWIVLALVFAVADSIAAAPDPGPTLHQLYREVAAAVEARRWDEALARQAELVRRIEALRASTLSPERRRLLFSSWVGRYREYAAVLDIRGRHEEAFRIAELAKARTLLELATARRALDSGLVPAAEREQIALLERRAAALAGPEQEAVEREIAARVSSLEFRIPKLAQLSEARIPDLAEARALLPAGSVYLSFLVQDNVFMAMLVSPERGLLVQRLPVVPDLARSIASYRFLLALPREVRQATLGVPSVWRRKDGAYVLSHASPGADFAQAEDLDEIGDYLGEKLLGPVIGQLEGVSRIIVSPDGVLALLPFEALRLGQRYLVERFEVQYAASMAMYALSRSRAAEYARIPGRLDLLAVGGALYEEFIQVWPQLSVHHSLLMPPSLGLARTSSADELEVPQAFQSMHMTWRNLPGSEIEVDMVAKLFDPGRSRVLKGGEATEERVWSMNSSGDLAKFRYLLFATHGYASSVDPRLSSVVLNQVGNRNGFDGYLTAAEWPLYDLRSDLVVISACSTGLGFVAEGEGMMGLPFALQVAGTRSSLLTLWAVGDLPAADFVVQFFHRVRGGADYAAALAQTKRSFLADPRRRQPFFWAPFVLFGS